LVKKIPEIYSLTTLIKALVFLVMGGMLYGCATPSQPTGGPRDERAPQIVFSEPETGTVNYSGKEISLHFSEFVNRDSFAEALVIEPELGLIYELDWSRKSVDIEFENPLPDAATLIVTIGTAFSDLNGNELGSPYKIALSTGPDIDKGEVFGRIVNARTGETSSGNRVLLYRTPVDLSLPANYIGETDTSGVVKFSYLRQGRYKAFWVDDRNRNKIWDPQRERAQPFGKEFIELEKAGQDTLQSLYIANSDTAEPNLQGLGLFSSQRLRLRFSENIALTDSTRIRITDSTGTLFSRAYPLYASPAEQYVLFSQTQKALPPDLNLQLVAQNIADQAGNIQPQTTQDFTGSAQEDTTAQRIISVSTPTKGIFPDEAIEVTYAAPIRNAPVRDSLKVVVSDSLYTSWPNLEIQRNKLRILPQGSWEEGLNYEFRLWNPVRSGYKKITPEFWFPSDLGALNITFADTSAETSQRETQLLMKTQAGRVIADTSFVNQIEISKLAPVEHQLILYQDLNGNGIWDAGQVDPFRPPEPYYIRDDIPLQRGFTADLSVRFD